MSNGNVMTMEDDTRQWEGEREWQGGETGVHDLPTATKGSELGSKRYPTKEIEENVASKVQSQSIGTPTGKSEHRSIDIHRMENDISSERHEHQHDRELGYAFQTKLRAPMHRSLDAPGPETFGHKYMPFAAGFAHMASEAPVYRSSRLHMINPTAAVSDDISFYYTLDSGRVPPAVVAANPETSAEFVRNTSTQSQGGMFRRMMKPIK